MLRFLVILTAVKYPNSRLSLRGKCPYSEFFWSVLFHIQNEYEEIRIIIQPEYGKIRTIRTPNMDTFHAVKNYILLQKEVAVANARNFLLVS